MTNRAVQLDNEYRKRSRTIGVQNMSRVAEKNKEEINLDDEDFDKEAGLDEDKKQEMNELLAEVNDNLFSKEEAEKDKEVEDSTQFEKLTEEEKLNSEKKWI